MPPQDVVCGLAGIDQEQLAEVGVDQEINGVALQEYKDARVTFLEDRVKGIFKFKPKLKEVEEGLEKDHVSLVLFPSQQRLDYTNELVCVCQLARYMPQELHQGGELALTDQIREKL